MDRNMPERYRDKPALLKVSREEAGQLHATGGFSLTVSDIKKIFAASDSWVGKHWTPFVSHIYYPCDGAVLWFSREAFWKRYEENAVASRQQWPQISPWESAETRQRILDRASVDRAGFPWERVDLPRDADGDYRIGFSVRQCQEIVAAAQEKGEAAGMGRSREAVLRRLYVVGAIKIEIFGKVLWNPPNDMPSK